MSGNQSRVERTEGQIKKSARSGSGGQQRGFVGSGGGGWKGGVSAPPPISSSSTVSSSLSTSRSFKKSFNGQSQSTPSRGNASSEASGAAPSAAGHHALENGAQPQTHSLGFSDGLDPRAAKPVDMSIPRNISRAIPKPPSSQSGAGFSNSQAPSAPAKGDASKPVTLQFGSINPGIMNGLQIPVPARTSSAPPNLDEQIRNQARTESFRAAPKISAPSVPKQQQQQTKKDAVGVHQSSSGESHSVHVKRDLTAPVPSAPVVPAPKSSALPITGISFPIAMPFQPQQPQVPAQFGVPNVQFQSGLASNSMQMPIALPVGNNSQVAQQIYVPSIQSHFMQQQAMMHQGQGLAFAPPIGHPLPQQLGNLGMGISQFTQQHSGKYGVARKTTVKITHPDTHEELKLDKNIDTIKDSLSAAQRTLPNVFSQSQSVPTYAASHQMNFFSPMQQTSYSRPQVMYPTNVPLVSGQMPTSSQAPRLSYPVSQSGQNLTYLNSSMSNMVPSVKPVSSAPLRGFSEGVNLDTLPVSTPMSNAVQVTIKPSVGSQNTGVSLTTPSVVISMPSTKTEPSKLVKATEENINSKQKQTVIKPDEPVQQLKSASGQSDIVKLLVNETSSTNAVPVVSAQTVHCEHSSVSETTGDSGSDLVGNDGKKNEPVRRSDSFKNNRWKSSKNDLKTQQRHQVIQLNAFSAEGAKVSPTSEDTTLLNEEAIESVEAKVMLAESSSFKEVLKKETSQDASLGYADSSKEIPSESPLCQIIDGTDAKRMNSNSRVVNTVSEVRKDRVLEVGVAEKFEASDASSKDSNDFEVLPSSTHSNSSELVNPVASSEQDSHVGNFGKVRSGHYDKAIDKLLNDSTSDVGHEMQEDRIRNLQNRPTNVCLDVADDSETIANSSSTKHEMQSDKDIDLIDSGVAPMETVNVSDQPLSVEHKPEPKHSDLNSECKSESKPLDSCSDVLVSASGLGQTEKHLSETPKPKISTGKKKKKEMLSKADAADTSDLYTAYKGPEEENSAKKSETINNSTVVKNITQTDNLSKDTASNEEDMHNRAELDDWENAADISTSKLKASDDQQPINDARKQHKKGDGYEATSHKYSRDFLVTLAQYFTHLPINFQTGSDIADALLVNPSGHSPSPSTGRVNDRSSGVSRADRRTAASTDDEKWLRPQASFGRDIRTDYAHGNATVSLRPGQAGSHVVLRTLPRQTSNQGILSGPMPSPVSQIGLSRGNPDADRWSRTRGLIPSPHTPLQVMHKAEKKYEVGKVSDNEDAKQRQLKAILNKLTPQNFDILCAKVTEVNIDNATTLTGVISQIFDKALMEPTFCEMYANFCCHLATMLPDFSEDNEKITFKRMLLNKCQEEFERGEKEQAEANKDEEEGEIKQSKGEREEKRLRARRRMLGNIRLIGELYKKKMLTERIMHECINKLLGQYQNPDEEDIEALCKLMSTIGEMIDHSKAKEHMDAYFDLMAELSTSQKLSSRVRFMLRDAIDLRKNKWQQRRKVEGPKKIDEVHRDAAQERQAQSSRLSRGPIISNVPRRGPAADYGSRGPTLLTSPGTQQQVSGIRGLPSQVRGYGIQDVRMEDRHQFEGRTMSLPLQHRSTEDDSITLGPQGGLAKGMSIRGQPSISNMSGGEIASVVGEHRRILSSTNDTNYMTERSTGAIFDEPSPGYQNNHQSSRDSKISDRTFERSSTAMFPTGRSTHGTSMSSQSTIPETRIFSEVLREKSILAIREFYSAKDEKEVALCVKELNAPDFYPSMISLWVTDSFERNHTERDLLAKLIVNFCKSRDSLLSQAQLLHGFALVLSSLEDAVNDAPRAAEFLGRLFTKVILQNVVTLKDIGKLIQEGGEEPGQLKEVGLAAEVLGSILETIRSESGDVILNEIRASSNLRLEDFRPPHPLKANKFDEFL